MKNKRRKHKNREDLEHNNEKEMKNNENERTPET